MVILVLDATKVFDNCYGLQNAYSIHTIHTISKSNVYRLLTCSISSPREDQHKAVIYESLQLLREAHTAFFSNKPEPYLDKVGRFTKSIMQTDLFKQKKHIQVVEGGRNVMADMLTTMEMQSMV